MDRGPGPGALTTAGLREGKGARLGSLQTRAMPPPLRCLDQEFLQRHTWPWGPSLAEKDALPTPSRGHLVAPPTPRGVRRGQQRALPQAPQALGWRGGADCPLLSWGDSGQADQARLGTGGLPLHHQDTVMSPGTRGGDGRWVGLGTSA